jgi:hypothetical protein
VADLPTDQQRRHGMGFSPYLPNIVKACAGRASFDANAQNVSYGKDIFWLVAATSRLWNHNFPV